MLYSQVNLKRFFHTFCFKSIFLSRTKVISCCFIFRLPILTKQPYVFFFKISFLSDLLQGDKRVYIFVMLYMLDINICSDMYNVCLYFAFTVARYAGLNVTYIVCYVSNIEFEWLFDGYMLSWFLICSTFIKSSASLFYVFKLHINYKLFEHNHKISKQCKQNIHMQINQTCLKEFENIYYTD